MQHLEVSGAVRPIYGSLGVKRLMQRRLLVVKFGDYLMMLSVTLIVWCQRIR